MYLLVSALKGEKKIFKHDDVDPYLRTYLVDKMIQRDLTAFRNKGSIPWHIILTYMADRTSDQIQNERKEYEPQKAFFGEENRGARKVLENFETERGGLMAGPRHWPLAHFRDKYFCSLKKL